MGTFTFNIKNFQSVTASAESNLYSNTKNEDLTYTGDDYIIWDRVNAERLRRGLIGLDQLGYPRPSENLLSESSSTPSAPQVFEVKGPASLTYEQAKAIFEKQYSTGSLVGLKSGDVLNAATQAAGGLTSALAQLGSSADDIVKQVAGKLPDIKSLSIQNPVDLSTFVDTKIIQEKIGSVDSTQLQGLIAQAAKNSGQTADQITVNGGLGKYGLNIEQLQTAGLIKPGLTEQISANPSKFVDILSSPTSWTGKMGVTDLQTILDNPTLQTKVQQTSMTASFNQLKQLGSLTGNESANVIGPVLQNASKFGVDAAKKWLSGQAPASLVNEMNNIAKSANFSQAFADLNIDIAGGGSPLDAGTKTPIPSKNTVNRTTVNESVKKLIGNSKIPLPVASKPIEDTFYANTSDEDLIYTGDDYVVWDRINYSRLQRGLPGLAAIGYPRPPETA